MKKIVKEQMWEYYIITGNGREIVWATRKCTCPRNTKEWRQVQKLARELDETVKTYGCKVANKQSKQQ